MSIKTNEIDFFTKMMDSQGVAVSTVSDGHIIIFKREFLQSLLDKYSDRDSLTIFIKRPEFKN
jgi:hypothetical protein